MLFLDLRQRIKRVLDNALSDSTYVSSERSEDGKMLLLRARRSDGHRINVRFRGVRDSNATTEPDFGSPLRVRHVSQDRSLLALLVPVLRAPGAGHARVRIEAGDSRLEIICEDAEWWEEEASPD